MKSPLDPDNFIDLKLKKAIPYNHNSSKFVFELPNNEASLIPITSCVVVRSSDPQALVDKNGKPVIRPYTPISAPEEKGEFTFLVKKYETGNMSKHFFDLKKGDTLAFKGPIDKFPWKSMSIFPFGIHFSNWLAHTVNEFDEVALIGGGSGITPLYQVLQHVLPDKTNRTKFTLLFANVSEEDILMREVFDEMKTKYPDTFSVVYALDKPPKEWQGIAGYVSKADIQKHVAPPSLGDKVKVFVCGPPGQMASISGNKAGKKQGELGGILKELGYTEDQVRVQI
ncbi:NADH-cytochrome b5 reductase [Fistulina hepatica ATCC 64428]|uniref:NADH-cytochrome b5 reductase n=1 Tax=Fistulina hepatica ATCC 64428 TaxID=1128425 RepID=A0A0D7AGC9_9AGAR|nr:NADH-cytochrome b5 reductase [Fistulina hepatica ATCC 64428]